MSKKANSWSYETSARLDEVPGQGGAASLQLPRVTTDWLMRGRREIVVQHGLAEYRLRITAAGKLILTK